MPIFFQHQINDNTRLGIWKIEESEAFFRDTVPQHRQVTHPHKRVQHLAGRFLLQFLFPAFPYELIQIADTRKPYLPDAQYHFSISHCGDYAAAIVSRDSRVGIDIEIPVSKIEAIAHKFLSEKELHSLVGNESQIVNPKSQISNPISQRPTNNEQQLTLLWSAKEAVYKWHGDGGVDFKKDIRLSKQFGGRDMICASFGPEQLPLDVFYHIFDHIVLAWVIT